MEHAEEYKNEQLSKLMEAKQIRKQLTRIR